MTSTDNLDQAELPLIVSMAASKGDAGNVPLSTVLRAEDRLPGVVPWVPENRTIPGLGSRFEGAQTRDGSKQSGMVNEGMAGTLPDLDSFQKDDLLEGTDLFGASALDRAVQRFMEDLVALGQDVGGGMGLAELLALLIAAGVAVTSIEVVRQRRKRANESTRMAEDEDDTLLPGFRAPHLSYGETSFHPGTFWLR